MAPIISRLYADHRNMGELLEVLERQLCGPRSGEQPDYAIMLDIMRYATHYADLFHHPREDFIFDLLAGREPASADLVTECKREHRVLADMGRRLFERLWAARDGTAAAPESLGSETSAYVAALRRHMAREEEELFPLAQAVLREADGSGLERALPEREDPVFGRTVTHEYRTLRARARCEEPD